MKLRTYIFALSVLVVSVVLTVLSIQSQKILEEGFQNLDSMQAGYIGQRVKAVISSKKEYLDHFMGILSEDPRFTNPNLASQPQAVSTLVTKVKHQAKFDLVDYIVPGKTSALIPEWPVSDRMKSASNEKDRYDLVRLEGEIMLVRFSRLPNGAALVLGYHLNQAFSQRIAEVTASTISFDVRTSEIPAQEGRFELYRGKWNTLSANIIPDQTRLNSIAGKMRSSLFFTSAILLVVLLVVFYLALDFGLVRGLKRIVSAIEGVSEGLDKGHLLDAVVPTHRVSELSSLTTTFSKFMVALKKYDRKEKDHSRTVAEMEKQAALAEMAQQVAHDLRSPLSALDMFMETAEEMPEEKRVMMRGCIHRITDIANSLLPKSDSDGGSAEPVTRMLVTLIEPLLTEKRLKYSGRANLSIESNLKVSSYGLFIHVNPQEFRRAISNIIDNAAEAIETDGTISISSSLEGGRVVLRIKDTGKGIPQTIISELGRKGFSYDKRGGSGLGLHYAMKRIADWGGSLRVESTPGEGTCVSIALSREVSPAWFVPELEVENGATVVVLDDDPSIHSLWKDRIGRLGSSRVILQHFTSAASMEQWLVVNPLPAVLLVDYELIGGVLTGLDIIRDHHLEDRAILVTSRYDDSELKDIRLNSDIKMIPKFLAGFVPIKQTATGQLPDVEFA